MNIEQATKFFGCVSEYVELDVYLNKIGVFDRPAFIENPMHWVNDKEKGFTFMLVARPGYDETYEKSKGKGNMVFEGVRVYGKNNTDNFSEYSAPLPFGLSFNENIDAVKNVLGTPAVDDEAPGEENRLCIWRKVSMDGANFQLSIVFLPRNLGISFMTFKPVALRFQ